MPPQTQNEPSSGLVGFDVDTGSVGGTVEGDAAKKAADEKKDFDPLKDEQIRLGLQESLRRHLKLRLPDMELEALKSLLFTAWQHALLLEAKAGFMARPPLSDELGDSQEDNGLIEPPNGLREISLGGIVYANSKEWTVWLNGQRISPDALPEEIVDIKVSESYVDLKWYDENTKIIFPVRLRPHQRFNFDSLIFLPGAGAL